MPTKKTLTPGAIGVETGTLHKTKEDVRLDSIIPSEILENKDKLDKFLQAYYTFMNMDEFIYQETLSFDDIVLGGLAQFRIADPNNDNNKFFTDETGADSTLVLTSPSGTTVNIPLTDINVAITNGNELPGSLATSTSEIGKTFTVNGLDSYNNYTAKLTTIVKYWVGPGPSYVMNTIEEAMDIDTNENNYLELMQKEIAATIPRGVTVNKRNLYKQIIDFYRLRGSSDSIEIFFKILFNDFAEVEFPYDKVLIPSSGNWDVNPNLTKGGQYLDNKGFLSDSIVVQDSLKFQKFSYLIKTGKNLSDWELSYDRLVHPAGFIYFAEILIFLQLTKAVLGEDEFDTSEQNTRLWDNLIRIARKVLSSMPNRQPGIVGPEDIPLLVEMFASTFLPSADAFIHKTGTLSVSLKTGVINGVTITDSGSGYITYPTFDGSSSSIINVSNNTIQLTTAHQESLLVGSKVTYSSGGGTVIGGLVNNTQYYIISSTGGKVKLSETSGGSEIDITSVGSGTSHTITKEIITTSDSGTPSGFTTAILSNTFTNGSLSGITITDGGKDYQTPVVTIAAPSAITFDGSDEETPSNLTGIIHLVDNTIKLTTAQQEALPVGSLVTYNTTGGAIPGLSSAPGSNQYYIVSSTGGKVKLSQTSGGSAIEFEGVGSGTSHTFTGETATITATTLDGALESITIAEPGFGYPSSPLPAITFNGIELEGQTGVAPSVTIGLDAKGRLDIDNITINSEGSGWKSLFASVAVNANASSIASIDFYGLGDKNYLTAPTIIFPQPTAKDADGNLLSSNVLAAANFTLDSDGEIAGVNITNPGNGYISDPIIRLGSSASNELRVPELKHKSIINLNHNDVDTLITEVKVNPVQTTGSIMTSTESADKFLPEHRVKVVNTNFRTIINNNYIQRKGTSNYFDTARLYNSNQTIEFLNDKTLQTIDSTDINNYNTSTFVHVE